MVRIHGQHIGGLGPGQQQACTAGQGQQDGRVADIHIGTIDLRTGGAELRPVAATQVHIVRRHLIGPEHPAAADIDRHDGIGGRGGRCRPGITGAEVDRAALRIDGRRIPDRAAGRSGQHHAVGLRGIGFRFLGNHPGLPDPFPSARIERHHAAARRTAGVVGGAGAEPFRRRHRHQQLAVEDAGTGRDSRHEMLIDATLPQQRSRAGIERIDVGAAITKINCVARRCVIFDRRHGRGSTHRRSDFERPVDTAAGGIERIEETVVAADEHSARNDAGLGIGRDPGRKAERPFEPQVRHILRADAGGRGGLESMIGGIRAPPVPLRHRGRVRQRRIVTTLIGHGSSRAQATAAQWSATHELGDAASLRVAQAGPRPRHDPIGSQCLVDFLRRHAAQGFRRWRALNRWIAVTAGAFLLEQREPGLGAGSHGRLPTGSIAGGQAGDADHCGRNEADAHAGRAPTWRRSPGYRQRSESPRRHDRRCRARACDVPSPWCRPAAPARRVRTGAPRHPM